MSLLMCIDVPINWGIPSFWGPNHVALSTTFYHFLVLNIRGRTHNHIYIYTYYIVDVYFIMAIMIHDES